tara:strand:- start:299 stop:703 length:405 start_codon:yes stop_codon:yes gene_type:complete
MKITKEQLTKIIKEELANVINEENLEENRDLQQGLPGRAHDAAGAFAKFAMRANGGERFIDEESLRALIPEFTKNRTFKDGTYYNHIGLEQIISHYLMRMDIDDKNPKKKDENGNVMLDKDGDPIILIDLGPAS